MVTLTLGILGLLIGSSINAIVWRLYVGRHWTRGRSICPACEHLLAAKDLVPVASWLALRGKCRYCQVSIHWQYPVVEAVTALLFGLSAARLAPDSLVGFVGLGFWLVILTLLIILAVYDARWMILPDKIMIPTIVIALFYLGFSAISQQSILVLRGPLLAAVITGAAFYALAAFSRGKAMGGGDIKLAFLMGLLLGLKGTLVALLFAFNSAAVVGLALIATHIRRRRDHIPFGPFLVAGTVVAFLYGQDIVNWYLSLNNI